MRIFIFSILLVTILTGCSTTRNKSSVIPSDKRKQIEARLGISIQKNDYLPFFLVATEWLGTPYRAGGVNKRGVDCSGFVTSFYKQVFDIRLVRNSEDIYEKNCHKIRKSKLQPGDLVFFNTRRKRGIDHVGIYLRNNKFIHASTSRGVIVSDLEDPYYKRAWKNGGRVKL